MAQDLFSRLAQQTLAELSPASQAPQEAGDDPVSAIYQVAQERGIDPAHLLGLAKLETQAGRKTVKGDGADTRNLFNVKDFSKDGAGIRARDNAEGSNDRYRQYGSYRESVEDLASLLERRYPGAAKASTPEEFARELKRGGYATDPAYERKLASTIRSSGGARSPERPQEWDQGARYAPVGLAPRGVEDSRPAEKPSKSAGFWGGAADVGLSTAQGVVGSVKALTDLAGSDNAVSRGLDDASKGLEKFKSDASQQDRQYHQQQIKAAEASGDWKTEVAAYANMVWDMPLESLAQGVGSFATLGAGKVAQMAKLASAAKKAGVAKEAFLKTAQGIEAAKKAGDLGMKVNVGLGVGQGIGGVKGSQYEQTYNAAKESGLSEQQAQTLATEAQSYQQGWGQQALGAGLGYVAGKTGPIEKLAAGKTVGAGGVARRFVGGGLLEAGTEGAQGGQERYAGNAAAIDAGVMDPSKQWAGVAGSGASEAITAGILGGGAGALGRPDVDPQAQAKAAAQKSGGIVSRAGLAATPGAQSPNPAAPNQPAANPAATSAPGAAGNTAAAPSKAKVVATTTAMVNGKKSTKVTREDGSVDIDGVQVVPPTVAAAGAPNPYFDGATDEALESMARFLTGQQAMTDGTPITETDRKLGRDALAELQRRRLAAKASPQPAASQTPIQASAIDAIEQALEADKARRRAAGEVVDDDVTDVEVKAPAQPVAPAQPAATPAAPVQPAAEKLQLSDERDPMLPQALDVLRQGGRPSVSSIQRGLKIGYNRAARILEEMERDGIVGPMGSDGLRQILRLPDPPGAQSTPTAQPASAGFSLPAFDSSPIPKMDPAAADEQRRQFAEFEQKRKNRRAGTRASAWERNPMLAFLGANGINRDTANEFAPGLTERRKAFVPGYGPVFRAGAKNLDELVQTAKEDGFLSDDDGEPELYDLIDRALRGERIAPLYADGAAEAEGERRLREMQERESATFDDYLAQQEADPLDLTGEPDYDERGLAEIGSADVTVQNEVAALQQQYADLGFDPADVLESLATQTENLPDQAYYDLAKSRFIQLLDQAYGQAEPQAEQGGDRAVRLDTGPQSDAQADGGAAGSQAAPVTPPAAPIAASLKRADAIRAKLDGLKSQGFSQFTKSGGRTLLLNPDTYETVELTPAEMAVAKAASGQARAGLQSLLGQRKPVQVGQQGADVLQSYTPADVLAQDEQAQAAQSQQAAEQQVAAAKAKADDERRRIEQASYAAADSFELGQNPLDSLTGQQDIFGAAPVAAPMAQDLAGEKINDEWTAFDPQSGTLGIPRAEMPQIKAEHRGAMMGFLKARGIDGQQESIPSAAIKPTQAEFSPGKVKKAIDRQGGNRSIIVSADGYVVDGHHQWLAAREKGEPIPAIRLDQNIGDVLTALKDMPSAQTEQAAQAEPAAPPKKPTRDETESEIVRQAMEAWTNQTANGFVVNQHYPAIVRVNGKDRRLGLFKKKGDSVLYAEALEQTIYGPSFTQFKVTGDGKLEKIGDRNLYGRDKAVADEAISAFNALFEQGGQQEASQGAKAEPAQAADPYPLVEHTTAKGKVLRGFIVRGMTEEQVKANIDPYALKKDGGVFVREQHKAKLPKPAAGSSGRGPAASQTWKNEGKSPADLIAEKAQSAGRELAVQVAEESREQDFRPSEIPQAVEQWAADARVPTDDLKRVLLQELPSLGVSEARIQQIRVALYPVLKPAASRQPAAAPAQQDSQTAAGQQWDAMTNAERVTIALEAGLPPAAAKKWSTRALANIDAKVRDKLAAAMDARQAQDNAVYELPVDERVFADALGELIDQDDGNQDDGEAERYQATFNPDVQRISLPRVTAASPKPAGVEFLPQAEANQVVQSWKDEAARQGKQPSSGNYTRTVISLFDASGVMSRPWEEAGYNVIRYDIQNGDDINDFNAEMLLERHGDDNIWAVIAQPPCTDFASSGAQWWAEKDAKGLTEISNELVRQTMRTLELFRPPVWWLENPVGRMQKLNGLPDPVLSFDPWHFGDPWTKRTSYWGNFNPKVPTAMVEPIEGSKVHKLSSSAKFERSLTPEGVAYAMFMANNANGMSVSQRLTHQYPGIDAKLFERALAIGQTEQDITESIEDSYYENDLEAVREILMQGGQQDLVQPNDSPVSTKGMTQAEAQQALEAGQKLLHYDEEIWIDRAKTDAVDSYVIKSRYTDLPVVSTKGPAGPRGTQWGKSEAAKRAVESMGLPQERTPAAPVLEAGLEVDRLTELKRDLVELRQRIKDQGQISDDRLIERERKLNDLVNELERDIQKAKLDQIPPAAVSDEARGKAFEAGQATASRIIGWASSASGVARVKTAITDSLMAQGYFDDGVITLTRQIVEELRQRDAQAQSQPAGREGYDTPVELDSAQLKTVLEQTRGEPLVDKPAKLEAWRNGTAKTDPAKFPVELVFRPDGKLDVNDGRHRIALAAERGEKVTAFIDGKDAQRAKDMLNAAPGTRFNGATERAAADRLDKLYAQMGGIMQRNTREAAAKSAVRSVIEELRKPRTATSIVPMLDGAANGLERQYSAMADVIREVADSLSGPAIRDFIDGKRDTAPTLEEVQAEQAASPAAANADLEAIFDQLDGITQRTQASGQQAAAAHPQAERIQLVQKHILDILEDLEDSGKVTINC